MTALGIGLSILCLIAGLFVDPALLIAAMSIILMDIYIEWDNRKRKKEMED